MRVHGGWLVAAVSAALLLTGCPKPDPETSSSSGAPGQPGVGAHVVRGKEKRSLENDIRQLAQLMVAYNTENGHPPKSWEEFKPYIQREAGRIVQEIEEQQIAVLWGAPLNSGTIIAYEVQADLRGSHVVARGDGSVVTMPTAQLQAALQGRGQ